jgi:dTDP-4-amino-4,6-dideoxygalactose transaminase
MGSFHATKLFHTIEGGCLVTKDQALSDRLELMKRFGHQNDDHRMLGINAKASEFQAAMGLCVLEQMPNIIAERKVLSEQYDALLGGRFTIPKKNNSDVDYNYAYYPIVLKSEQDLLAAMDRLENQNIFPRRYFYPSLNTLPYIHNTASCPVSEDIAVRILCLPLYNGLAPKTVNRICEVLCN